MIQVLCYMKEINMRSKAVSHSPLSLIDAAQELGYGKLTLSGKVVGLHCMG